MEPSSNPDIIPWELIAADLQDSLSSDERAQLAAWLDASPRNRETWQRLRDAWGPGVHADPWYRQADPETGWQLLLTALKETAAPGAKEPAPTHAPESRPIHAPLAPDPSPSAIPHRIHPLRWAAAAIVILAVGAAILFYGSRRERSYEAGPESRQVQLPDGTFVTLRPGSRIRLDKNFGQNQRLVFLDSGTAYFEVLHDDNNPFTVRTIAADIHDLGTRFTVLRQGDSINVSVLSGRIDFVSRADASNRQLSAGMEVTFRTTEHRFGPVAYTGYIGDSSHNQLRFSNETLDHVTAVLHAISGKPIRLADPTLGQRTLSIHLDGESFNNAIKIICTSLDLDYIVKNDTCIIKSRHE